MRKIQKRKKWKRGVIRRGDEEKSGEKRKALGEN